MSAQEEMDLVHRSVFLIPKDTGPMTIAQEFATAKYALSKNQLKAWYLFIASMDEHHVPEQGTMYTFDAVRFADKLNINATKARGIIVAEIFTKLSQNYIDLRSREDGSGEQDIYHANFISELSYNRKTHILEVSIPPRLNQYLFNLREGTYISMDIEDILALDTIVSMRLFIYLRNLGRLNIHEISVDRLRREIALYPESSYKEFKRRVITPSIEEIRCHTKYKDFFIDDDGGPGRKATTIVFGFTKTPIGDTYFPNLAPALVKQLREKFSERILVLFSMACDEGFEPSYIKDSFDGISEACIVSNFHLVFDRITKDARMGKKKGPDTYGRYFITAVKQDWAGASHQGKTALKKGMARIENKQLEERMREAKEQEDNQDRADYYLKHAKEYVAAMTLSDLLAFMKRHASQLDYLAGRRGFNREHACSRKKTYREYRLLTQVVLGKMMAGEIPVSVNSSSLFE